MADGDENTSGMVTPVKIVHHMLTRNWPVHMRTCESSICDERKAEYRHRSCSGATVAFHFGPSNIGIKRSARSARPMAIGNAITASGSVSSRK